MKKLRCGGEVGDPDLPEPRQVFGVFMNDFVGFSGVGIDLVA